MYPSKSFLWQLLAFIAILLALNGLFQLHISIIGSVLLTVVLSLAFSGIRRR